MLYFALPSSILRTRIASLEEELKGFWKVLENHRFTFSLPHYALVATRNENFLPSSCSFRAGLGVAPMGATLVAGGAGDWVTTWSLGFCPWAHGPPFCKQFSNVSISIKFIRLGVCIRKMWNWVLKSPRLPCSFISKAGAVNSSLDEWPNSRCSLLTFWRISMVD